MGGQKRDPRVVASGPVWAASEEPGLRAALGREVWGQPGTPLGRGLPVRLLSSHSRK